MTMFYITSTSGAAHKRYSAAEPHTPFCQIEMHRVGSALLTAEITTRPGFREMADTLQWEHMR